LSQMQHLDSWVLRRHQIKTIYDDKLASLPLTLPWQHPDSWSALHLYPVRLELQQMSRSHSEVFELLRAQKIGVNLHYIPVHLQPYYQELGFRRGDFPAAEHYYAEAISIPMYPGLDDSAMSTVVATLEMALQ